MDLKQMLALVDRAGATRMLQCPSFGTVLTGTDSTPQPIRFTWDGFVVGLYGAIASGVAADYGGTALRVQLGGTEDMFVDGQGGPASVSFLGLFGGVPNYQRIVRRVVKGDLWTFTVHNGTAGSVAPSVWLSFLADKDVAQVTEALAKGGR
jgi:hypothetical protein